MLTEEDIQQIEAWLDGALDKADLVAFEARLHDDPGFAAEVVLHQKMRLAVGEKDVGAFRQTVGDLLRERRAAPQNKFVFLRYTWIIAAALLLALAAIWYFNRGEATPEQLYAEAFQPPARFHEGARRSDRPSAGDSIAGQQADWTALNAAWAAGEQEKALLLALEIARTSTVRAAEQEAYFAAGVIALAQKKPEDALQYLPKAEGPAVYKEEIQWYTALARVQLAMRDPAQKEQAVQALKAVKQGSQPKGRYALVDKLLRALND